MIYIIYNIFKSIYINRNFAKAELEASEKNNPIYFHFYKEDGIWKIDLTALFNISNQAMKRSMEKMLSRYRRALLILDSAFSSLMIFSPLEVP